MDEAEKVWHRYIKALDAYNEVCFADPANWHQPNTREFSDLRDLLRVFAEQGDVRCRYAVAAVYSRRLCCNRNVESADEYEESQKEATPWWIRAAMQGHWFALDNLITCGIGPEADRVRLIAAQFELQRRDLVGEDGGMPIYGFDFMQELCKVIYGRVMTDL